VATGSLSVATEELGDHPEKQPPFPHPVTVLSGSGFSSFLEEFLIQALTANSIGVVR